MTFSSKRPVAAFFLSLMAFQLIYPMTASALTSGPTAPEVQSFQPAGTSEMVNTFTGDFSYNIPLFELPGPNGGYPFNLSYQAGVTMDQEASWVGLGWTLQPGAITRQMRGLPDEFNGDNIYTKMSVNPSITIGAGAGVGAELFGADGLSLNVGFSVYNNNYKGPGYTVDGTVGFSAAIGSGLNAGLGMGFSLDSNEGLGVNVNPYIGLSTRIGEIGVGAGYNSKQGLTSVSVSAKQLNAKNPTISSSISLVHPSYTPQVTMPMRNTNVNFTGKMGASWWGIFPSVYFSGFYNKQSLDKNQQWFGTPAYGYLNYQNAAATPSAVLDFNREKDGMITQDLPNLPVPSQTYDIYSVSGQGIGMMYRPVRNDYGALNDQQMTSKSNTIGVGFDFGPVTSHAGVNLSLNLSRTTSGPWTNSSGTSVAPFAAYQTKDINKTFEPWYYKVHGEATSVPGTVVDGLMGGEKAERLALNTADYTVISSNLENNYESPRAAPDNGYIKSSTARKDRNDVIIPITNGELVNSSGTEVIPYYKVIFRDTNWATTQTDMPYKRAYTGTDATKIAGYTALTKEGVRYVYGLPVYNKNQEEISLAVNKGTGDISRAPVSSPSGADPIPTGIGDGFFKRTQLPSYATTYMLTAIVGPDYIDITNDGVTADDMGYWVRFTYQKTSGNYQWRDPFSNAHYIEGWMSDTRDDKGSITYGKKELWYLSRAETKSHIADFNLGSAARTDGLGALTRYQSTATLGVTQPRLDNIALYTRTGTVSKPLQIVKFNHGYTLCPGIENSSNATGKLTLNSLTFQYGGSSRGLLNPYEFTYSSLNPAYDLLAVDRWGNYKPYPAGQYSNNRYFPYSAQDLPAATIKQNSSAWNLTQIKLPSGGVISVDYESDDYAYVQNKQAMQMVQLVDPNAAYNGTFQSTVSIASADRKVRFKLKSLIPVASISTVHDSLAAQVMKYIDTQTAQLYFKVLTNIGKSTATPANMVNEYICGYGNIDVTNTAAMNLITDPAGANYAYGEFALLPETTGGSPWHPFVKRAVQHLRTNQPDLANKVINGIVPQSDVNSNPSVTDLIAEITSVAGLVTKVRSLFQGFEGSCTANNMGVQYTPGSSWIRLNTPDKIKFGGGSRVRQITMTDPDASASENVYGQLYEYTTTEGGMTISSGVAAYEPIVGGDENTLHYAKNYSMSAPLRSDNNMYIEFPLNESYYPSPVVGYQKVTVTSLAAAALAGKTLSGTSNIFPVTASNVTYGTSGMTVSEFYTAKDFPVITDETDKVNKASRYQVSIPLFGSASGASLITSQGYSIITNDMHGKPKATSTFRQQTNGLFEPNAASWVRYTYLSEARVINKVKACALVNRFKDNLDGTVSAAAATDPNLFYLAQEQEMFYDLRQNIDNALGGGQRLNLDIVITPFFLIPVPVPAGWPTIETSTTQMRTAVTNKVIFKSGILSSVQAFDGGATLTTSNLKWDKLTGEPVLTSVNNNFDDPVYTLTLPAFRQYQGMGAAYQNVGLTFSMTAFQENSAISESAINTYEYQFYTSLPSGTLNPGDEILLYTVGTPFQLPVGRVIYKGKVESDDVIYSSIPLTGNTEYMATVVRSGLRNQLSVSAGSVTALDDPTTPATTTNFKKKLLTVPKY